VQCLDFSVEVIKSGTERARELIVVGQERIRLRPQDAKIELAVEERNFDTICSARVPVRSGMR
jgi:hypothetical protein